MRREASSTRLRTFATAIGCLAVGFATAIGQGTNPQQPVFRAGVDLVPVEVVVVDGTGQAVHGLPQTAFRVMDRRKPQTVSVFEEVTRDPAALAAAAPSTAHADVADNRTAASQRLVILVIDDLHIDRPREDRTKELAKQVIDRIGAGASMAVLFTTGSHSTEVTEDHAALIDAVNNMKARQAERRPQSSPETAGGQRNSGQAFFQGIQEFKSLSDAARMLAGDDIRRKTFVMISEGINKSMTGMFDNAMTPCEAHGPVATRAGASPVIPCGSSMALHQMMEDIRRSNVTMYILDPRGAVSEQDLAQENFPLPAGRTVPDLPTRFANPVRLAQDGINIMAEASGGFAVTNSDDFNDGIQLIADDLNHYYLLGFYPSDPSGTEYRRLDVSIAGHPDWVLRFRKGYVPGGPLPIAANADPLVSAITPKTDLPLRLVAVPLPSTGAANESRVALILELSGPKGQLLDSEGRIHDDVSFQVLAINMKEKKAVARVGNSAKLVLKPVGDVGATVAYQIPASLKLAPGAYQLRASATSGQVGKAGSVYLTLDVPDFSSAPIAVSGLAIGYADGPHVALAGTDTTATDLGLPFLPALDRTFPATASLRVYSEIARSSLNAPIKATASILKAGGQVAVSSSTQIAANEHGRLDTTLSLQGLAPGPYTLSVSATDGKKSASREVAIVIK
jgi:VWFA-related protein